MANLKHVYLIIHCRIHSVNNINAKTLVETMFQKILMGLFNNLMKQKVTETIEILLEDRQDKKIGLLA